MSTWHQRQRPQRLWHETKWTLVIDPPNGQLTVERFDTPELANEQKQRLMDAGQGYVYVLHPQNGADV